MTEPSTTQRDELARDIFIADNSAHPNAGAEWDAFEDIGGVCGGDYAYDLADGLLAAGYRKPRTITTAEELDALEVESIVRDVDGLPKEKQNSTGGDTFWSAPGHRKRYGVGDIYLPATVLYEPEAEAAR